MEIRKKSPAFSSFRNIAQFPDKYFFVLPNSKKEFITYATGKRIFNEESIVSDAYQPAPSPDEAMVMEERPPDLPPAGEAVKKRPAQVKKESKGAERSLRFLGDDAGL